jgi:TonB family protein
MALSGKIKPPELNRRKSVRMVRPTGIGLVRTESNLKELPLSLATVLSTVLHVATPLLLSAVIALILLILSWLLHINIWDWFKPKEKPRDIEFVLVKDTQAKKPENAKFRGEFNQEAGGKTNPNKPIEAVDQPAPPSPAQAAAPQPTPQPPKPQAQPPAPQPQQVAKPQPQPQPKPIEKQIVKAPEPPKPVMKQPTPQKTAPAPTFAPTIPIPLATEIKGPPTPKLSASTGPIATQSATAGAQSGPVSIPTSGAQLASAAAGHPGVPRAGSPPGGASGNPEAGPGRIPGVSVAEADFGPYMSELKRRLTRNWRPPRGNETKRVVLKFEIARDGRLLSLEINRTSGEPLADEAAINAVKLSAPFKELPPEFQGDSVPVLFTFDYTVYGSNSSKLQRVTR